MMKYMNMTKWSEEGGERRVTNFGVSAHTRGIDGEARSYH